jgi:hypothetical protein
MYYREHYPKEPEDFLAALSLRGDNFLLQGKYRWLFRGQPGAHPLVPTAWRREAVAELSPHGPVESNGRSLELEREIAKRFFLLADARGLELPEDTQLLREYIYENRESCLGMSGRPSPFDPCWPSHGTTGSRRVCLIGRGIPTWQRTSQLPMRTGPSRRKR